MTSQGHFVVHSQARTRNAAGASVRTRALGRCQVKAAPCPPLSPEEAADLQRACLQDLWVRLGRVPGVRRVLCHLPRGSADRFCELLGRDTDLLAQSEG